MSPRTILGIIHLSVKNTRQLRRMPKNEEEHSGTKKNAREALSNLYEPTLAWGPIGRVI
jgi:hypothetical protein